MQRSQSLIVGYPAKLHLAPDDDAKFGRYGKATFGLEVNIRVHRCT